jgi:LemA protein
MWVLWVVLGLVALAVIFGIVSYNRFVSQRQLIKDSWANIDTELRRRYDLIPNLVETVRGFAAQERAVLEEVTRARATVAGMQVTPELVRDPEALRKFQEAQVQLGGALGRLLAVVERYPELKSNQNFLALQSQLEGTENRIAVERRRYNEAVREYNTAVQRFPASVVASLRGFPERPYFEAPPGSEAPPAIKF